ncbi:MAG: hypothetical protein RLZZ618_3601 [Pseudomonadota bacterium]|jgi:hypothetical protein
MALKKKGKYWYGSSPEDVQAEMLRFSKLQGHPAEKFAESVCGCGHRVFKLETDEDEGAAKRSCTACKGVYLMGDSAEYASAAVFENHECVCDADEFQLLSGVALYSESNDVRWYYIGCRCTSCSLVGVFAHWKCEGGDADKFLSAC